MCVKWVDGWVVQWDGSASRWVGELVGVMDALTGAGLAATDKNDVMNISNKYDLQERRFYVK